MELVIGLFFSILDVCVLFYFVKRCLNVSVENKLVGLGFLALQIFINTQINNLVGIGNPVGFLIMATTTVVIAKLMFKSNAILPFVLLTPFY